MNVRQQLVAFYAEHNPDKLADVDSLLTRFRGREYSLLEALKEKYGVSNAPIEQPSATTTAHSGVSAAHEDKSKHNLIAHPVLHVSQRSAESQETATSMSALSPAVVAFPEHTAACARAHVDMKQQDSAQPTPSLIPVAPKADGVTNLMHESSMPSAAPSLASVWPHAALPRLQHEQEKHHRHDGTACLNVQAQMRELLRRMFVVDLDSLAQQLAELTRQPTNDCDATSDERPTSHQPYSTSRHRANTPTTDVRYRCHTTSPEQQQQQQQPVVVAVHYRDNCAGYGSERSDTESYNRHSAQAQCNTRGARDEVNLESHEQLLFLRHTLCFLQYFVQCAREYMALAVCITTAEASDAKDAVKPCDRAWQSARTANSPNPSAPETQWCALPSATCTAGMMRSVMPVVLSDTQSHAQEQQHLEQQNRLQQEYLQQQQQLQQQREVLLLQQQQYLKQQQQELLLQQQSLYSFPCMHHSTLVSQPSLGMGTSTAVPSACTVLAMKPTMADPIVSAHAHSDRVMASTSRGIQTTCDIATQVTSAMLGQPQNVTDMPRQQDERGAVHAMHARWNVHPMNTHKDGIDKMGGQATSAGLSISAAVPNEVWTECNNRASLSHRMRGNQSDKAVLDQDSGTNSNNTNNDLVDREESGVVRCRDANDVYVPDLYGETPDNKMHVARIRSCVNSTETNIPSTSASGGGAAAHADVAAPSPYTRPRDRVRVLHLPPSLRGTEPVLSSALHDLRAKHASHLCSMYDTVVCVLEQGVYCENIHWATVNDTHGLSAQTSSSLSSSSSAWSSEPTRLPRLELVSESAQATVILRTWSPVLPILRMGGAGVSVLLHNITLVGEDDAYDEHHNVDHSKNNNNNNNTINNGDGSHSHSNDCTAIVGDSSKDGGNDGAYTNRVQRTYTRECTRHHALCHTAHPFCEAGPSHARQHQLASSLTSLIAAAVEAKRQTSATRHLSRFTSSMHNHSAGQKSNPTSAAPAPALIHVSRGATLSLRQCQFYGGDGGGVVLTGAHTRLHALQTHWTRCRWGGVGVADGGDGMQVSLHRCGVTRCEVGIRVHVTCSSHAGRGESCVAVGDEYREAMSSLTYSAATNNSSTMTNAHGSNDISHSRYSAYCNGNNSRTHKDHGEKDEAKHSEGVDTRGGATSVATVPRAAIAVHLRDCVVEDCAKDGLVLCGGVTATIERSDVCGNMASGAIAFAGVTLRLMQSSVERNGMYGVQRYVGSAVDVIRSTIRHNGFGALSEEEE